MKNGEIMKLNKQIKLTTAVLCSIGLLIGCSSSSGDMESDENNPLSTELETQGDSLAGLPSEMSNQETVLSLKEHSIADATIGQNGLAISPDISGEQLESYYKTSFTPTEQQVYDGVFQAIDTMANEYIISHAIQPETLQRIMRVMLIDVPDFFYLEPNYSYKVSDDNTVQSIQMNYRMTTEQRKELYQSLNFRTFGGGASRTENEYLRNVFRSISSPYGTSYTFEENEDFEEIEGNFANTIIPITYGKGNIQVTPIGFAKTLNFYLQRAGVQSLTVLGEFTATDYSDLEIENVPNNTISESVAVDDEDSSKMNVTVSADDVYAWNLVQIDSNWYHLDNFYANRVPDVLLRERTDSVRGFLTNEIENYGLGFLMSDLTASYSRRFYETEEWLGILPVAYNNLFYRIVQNQNPYITQVDSTALQTMVVNEILTKVYANQSSFPASFLISFEDGDNMQQVYEEASVILEMIENQIGTTFANYNIEKLNGSTTLLFNYLTYR